MGRLPIRLVTFDALYTIIIPRLPIHVQYSQVFEPYLGVLNPEEIRRSFKSAFRALEAEQPVYSKGSKVWWAEVIRRTALGAGADAQAVNASLSEIVPSLLSRFSSKEGYRAFEDALPALLCLREEMGIMTAVVSNADSRIRLALEDLGFPHSLEPVVVSEEEGVEKPDPEIFLRAIARVNAMHMSHPPVKPEECLHVGDELLSDYHGALGAGMNALLLKRSGLDGQRAHKGPFEHTQESTTVIVENLEMVLRWVKDHNTRL